MCDCESTVDVMIKYILWMTHRYRVKEKEGSRTPLVYSIPCVDHRLFVSWHCVRGCYYYYKEIVLLLLLLLLLPIWQHAHVSPGGQPD